MASNENETINGTDLNNEILGNSGDDSISGGGGDDTLDGGVGNDTLVGGEDNDYLIGAVGNDFLFGGNGNDTYKFANGFGNDTVADTSGKNILDFSAVTTGITVEDSLVDTTFIAGSDTLTASATLGKVTLGRGNDSVAFAANKFFTDTLIGGAGNDTLDFSTFTNNLDINMVTGVVTMSYGENTYTLFSTGFEIVTGNDSSTAYGDDTVTSNVNYSLRPGLDNLTLVGNARVGRGNSLANIITGSIGADTLIGGASDDTYIVQNTNDVVLEYNGTVEGVDTVQSYATYSLANNLESLVLMGTKAINGTGNSLANNVIGNGNNNIIIGGLGSDMLLGNYGNDTYKFANDFGNDTISDIHGENIVDLAAVTDDIIVEYTLLVSDEYITFSAGYDTLSASTITTLGKVALGKGDDNVGFAADTFFTDTLIAGAGNDTLDFSTFTTDLNINLNTGIVIASGHTLFTSGFENITGNDSITAYGIDTITAGISYTLGAGLENLILTGINAVRGVGNGLDNTLEGNTGIDILVGGDGDDTYVIKNSSTSIVETASVDYDVVKSSVSYSMANNLEDLVLTGNRAINGTGNALSNYITGNSLANIIIGGNGDDYLDGNAGNDTYKFANGFGNDTVGDTSGKNILDFSAVTTGITVEDSLVEDTTFIAGSDTLTASATLGKVTLGKGDDTVKFAANELFADTLIGGAGNDTLDFSAFTVGNNLDIKLSTGIVTTSGNTLFTSGFETFIGGVGSDTITAGISYTLGDGVDELVLTGGTKALKGTGNYLANTIIGNRGKDTLTGGDNNDTYIIYNSATSIIETDSTSSGNDTAKSYASCSLANNVENLTLMGAAALKATGNSLENIIIGNGLNNIIIGGAGNDELFGNVGIDTYVFAEGFGNDIVEDATEGNILDFSAVTGEIWVYDWASDMKVATADTENSISFGPEGAEISKIILGKGNDSVYFDQDVFFEDSLVGGGGNDSLDFSTFTGPMNINLYSGFATLYNGENTYTLSATGFENVTGSDGFNTITGNSSNNILDAHSNNGILKGMAGNDTYIVNGTGVTIFESLNAGIDTVMAMGDYSLSVNIENLTLTGFATNGLGNSLANTITSNVLNSTLYGGGGNDTYIVDSTGVAVYEDYNGGIDTVISSGGYSLNDYVENLTLTGGANVGLGNSLANTITSNVFSSTLYGGDGNDTYIVDGIGATVYEDSDEGIDTVISSGSYSLYDYVENLTLAGDANVGLGNSLANTITGNSLTNTITGGDGADTLKGMSGNDTYVFASGDGKDVIIDTSGVSTVRLGDLQSTSVAIYKKGYDLLISYDGAGTQDVITFKDYAKGDIREIQTDNGVLDSAAITNVINYISSYNANHSASADITTIEKANTNTELIAFIEAQWQYPPP